MKFLTYKRVEAVKVGIMDDNNMIYSLSEVLGHEEYGTMLECIAGISDAELARVDAFLKRS